MEKPVQHLDDFKLTNRVKDLMNQISMSIDTAPLEQKQELLSLLEDWQYGHKRGGARKPCSVDVDYATDGRAFKGSIKNVSVNGLFIETSFLLLLIPTLGIGLPTVPYLASVTH